MSRYGIPPIYKPKIYLNILNKLNVISNKNASKIEKKGNSSYFVHRNFGAVNTNNGLESVYPKKGEPGFEKEFIGEANEKEGRPLKK